MSLQKLTSLGRALAGRNLTSPGVNLWVIPNRQRRDILVAPPRGKCSKTELIVLPAIFCIAIFFIPGWVTFHMNEYGGKDKK